MAAREIVRARGSQVGRRAGGRRRRPRGAGHRARLPVHVGERSRAGQRVVGNLVHRRRVVEDEHDVGEQSGLGGEERRVVRVVGDHAGRLQLLGDGRVDEAVARLASGLGVGAERRAERKQRGAGREPQEILRAHSGPHCPNWKVNSSSMSPACGSVQATTARYALPPSPMPVPTTLLRSPALALPIALLLSISTEVMVGGAV